MKTNAILFKLLFSLAISICCLPLATAKSTSVKNMHRAITDHQGQLYELNAFDDRWFDAFDSRDLPALFEFYEHDSIMAYAPYDESTNLYGVDVITNMYGNGPFQILSDPVLTADIFLNVIHKEYGLQIKRWDVSHRAGKFSGLVIKVIQYENAWKRVIDYIIDDITTLKELASLVPDQYEQSIFNTDEFYQNDDKTDSQLIDLDTLTGYTDSSMHGSKITVQTFIPNLNKSTALLIATHELGNKTYLVISSLIQGDNHWKTHIETRHLLLSEEITPEE